MHKPVSVAAAIGIGTIGVIHQSISIGLLVGHHTKLLLRSAAAIFVPRPVVSPENAAGRASYDILGDESIDCYIVYLVPGGDRITVRTCG